MKIIPLKSCLRLQIQPERHKILTILLTTPVGSVSCERAFSALRRLKLWDRSTMNEERLSGLGMFLIHDGTDYIPEPGVIYQMKQNWRKPVNEPGFVLTEFPE